MSKEPQVRIRHGPRRAGSPPVVPIDDPSDRVWDHDLADVAQALLSSAVACFATKGFHGTSTRDITGLIGLTPGALYVHFASKEAVLFEIARTGHRRGLETLRAAPHTEDAAEHLRNLVRAHVIWHARHHTLARVCQYELASLEPDSRRQIIELRDETTGVFRDAVQWCSDGAFTETNVNRLARAILSLTIDMVRWYRLAGPDSAEDLGEFYADLALKLTARDPARRDAG